MNAGAAAALRYDPRRHAARSTDDWLFQQLLPYLGNKRSLLDLIGGAVAATGVDPRRATFVDAFAGSGVVARMARRLGFAVVANDWEPYARIVNTAALLPVAAPPLERLGGYGDAIASLNALPGHDGWVASTLCPRDDAAPDPRRERMFYRRATGRRIDAIRDRIAAWQQDGSVDEVAAACLLTPLLYQASWLANTSGVFKGFHHGWGGRNGTALHRILADLRLEPLRFAPSERAHRVTAVDVFELPRQLTTTPHVVYLDPPYNQHPYASNYHVLNSLVLWDRPEVPPPTERGWRAAIRRDWRTRRSPFHDRDAVAGAFARLFDAFDAPHLLLSYSTDGLMPVGALLDLAARHGRPHVHARRHKRYRTSPTRPSARPRTVEFVLRVDRSVAPRAADVRTANALVAAALAAT